VNGINERDYRARAEKACGQVRKTQGPISNHARTRPTEEETMPSEHVVGTDMTPRQFMPDRSTIAQSLVDTSAREAIRLL
jgi:hypothetical protein